MEDQKLWPGPACNQDFAKRRWKKFQLGNVLSKLVQVKHITDGGLKAEPSVTGGCGQFWKKITILKSLNHISHVFRSIRKKQMFNI